MDVQLPEWILDAQRQAHDLTFGRVPLELIVANGQVTKVVGSKTSSTKFSKTDNNDGAMMFIFDHINHILNQEAKLDHDGPKNGGTISLSIVHKNGKVSLVNTFDNIEYNYPMF